MAVRAPFAKYLYQAWALSGSPAPETIHASPGYEACQQLGETTSRAYVPIQEEEGSRPGLRADGLQRDWTFEG